MIFIALMGLMVIGPSVRSRLFRPSGALWAFPIVDRDMNAIRADSLRVIVLRDPLSWEQHPGAVTGLEWELLERFARKEKLPMKAVPAFHPDSALAMLQRGDGDVIAAQLCPDGPLRRFVAFTVPYRSVAPLRASLNTDALVRTTARSKRAPGVPDTLAISVWSPFHGLENAFDTSAHVVLVNDTALPEDLLVNVAMGLRRAALITDATGNLEGQQLPHIAFGPRLGRSVPLCFAVRRNSPLLLRALDAWLGAAAEKEARDALITSYNDGALTKGPVRVLRDLALGTDSISPFDSLFQVHADSSAYDWRLLAAVAFKESRFDTSVVSRAGAEGLMQMMPATSAALGVDTADGVDGHIGGATKYLAELDTLWRSTVPNKDQRLKFVLASYNAGPGHIKDAQRLAEKYGMDTHRWDGSVERALLLLSKPRYFDRPEVKNGYCRAYQTFWYVRDVVAAFGQFRKLHRPDPSGGAKK